MSTYVQATPVTSRTQATMHIHSLYRAHDASAVRNDDGTWRAVLKGPMCGGLSFGRFPDWHAAMAACETTIDEKYQQRIDRSIEND